MRRNETLYNWMRKVDQDTELVSVTLPSTKTLLQFALMKISLCFYILWVLLFQYSIAIPTRPGPNDHSQHPSEAYRSPNPSGHSSYQHPGPPSHPFAFTFNHEPYRLDQQGSTVAAHHGNQQHQAGPSQNPAQAGAPPGHGESQLHGLPNRHGNRQELNAESPCCRSSSPSGRRSRYPLYMPVSRLRSAVFPLWSRVPFTHVGQGTHHTNRTQCAWSRNT